MARFSTFLLADGKESLGQSDAEARHARRVMAEPACDQAGMKTVRSDGAGTQQLGQTIGEQDVGELGLLIGAPTGIEAPSFWALEVDLRASVHFRGDVDDAPSLGLGDQIEQQTGGS